MTTQRVPRTGLLFVRLLVVRLLVAAGLAVAGFAGRGTGTPAPGPGHVAAGSQQVTITGNSLLKFAPMTIR